MITADHAIFTSVRSLMGCGYRVIAASPGVTANERAEITRWSPSHGNLCSSDVAGEGLAIYRLSTGRRCIAWSRHAGPEPTGRGGLRIHTHAVLLSADAWWQLACLPLAVLSALEALGPEPLLPTGPCLTPLSIATISRPDIAWTACPFDTLHRPAAYALAGQHAIIVNPEPLVPQLIATLAILPAYVRESIVVSAGLRYSPGRPATLTWVSTPPRPAEAAGFSGAVLDPSRPAASGAALPPWLQLMALWWPQSRQNEILALTAELTSDAGDEALNRIIMLADDLDGIESTPPAELAKLTTQYSGWQPRTPLEAAMLDQLRNAVVTASS